MKKITSVSTGRALGGRPPLVDAQADIGYTLDGDFVRTAIMCRTGGVESLDIIAPDGQHLMRININTSQYPSVDFIAAQPPESGYRQHITVWQKGYRIDMPNPTPMTSILLTKDVLTIETEQEQEQEN